MFFLVALLEIVCGLLQIPAILTGDGQINLAAMVLLLLLGAVLLRQGMRFQRKQKEQQS